MAIVIFEIDLVFIEFVVIFIYIICANKNETKPNIKYILPLFNRKTSPKKEKNKPTIYSLFTFFTEA